MGIIYSTWVWLKSKSIWATAVIVGENLFVKEEKT